MKATTYISIITFLGAYLTGCVFSNCDKIDLKKDDLEKMSHYEDLNYLEFKSDSGNTDILEVTYNASSYSPCNKIELSKYQYQSRRISFSNSGWHGDTYSDVSFSLDNKYRNDSSAAFYMYVHNVICTYDEVNSIDTIKISNSFKPIVARKFQWDGSLGSGKNAEINSFHWSDSIGLVRYTTHSGEIYNLNKTVTNNSNRSATP